MGLSPGIAVRGSSNSPIKACTPHEPFKSIQFFSVGILSFPDHETFCKNAGDELIADFLVHSIIFSCCMKVKSGTSDCTDHGQSCKRYRWQMKCDVENLLRHTLIFAAYKRHFLGLQHGILDPGVNCRNGSIPIRCSRVVTLSQNEDENRTIKI